MAATDLIKEAQKYFPELQVKYKDQSTFMKILGKITFFNPAFMTTYLTTLGNTIYVPSEAYQNDPREDFKSVFIHECTHLYDCKRIGFPYDVGYAFPQWLSIIAVLATIFFSWKLAVVLGLLFLLPLPAPWRAHFERRAYLVQMYAWFKINGHDPSFLAIPLANLFRNSSYYWMWIFEKNSTFLDEATNVKNGQPSWATDTALLNMVNDLIDAAKK